MSMEVIAAGGQAHTHSATAFEVSGMSPASLGPWGPSSDQDGPFDRASHTMSASMIHSKATDIKRAPCYCNMEFTHREISKELAMMPMPMMKALGYTLLKLYVITKHTSTHKHTHINKF